ncbi:Oidioi.mRNA.OKI2018_I69.PAR.g9516.t2.cds [Oikopleura dioica]|uniref:Oidioi.mRNA.OKI2018_I69.PAR.g9516.t2.cds n=1 Tax=Oikopleura dioica TaxID=34765 RepID=A0ABN7RRI1_OIKDI|nr:Oidioi.mRNA.OKI2018_I69.PAR.g9516.t2.cds [Oikopleura dioica]
MSRTGEITLKTYKLAFESWLSQYNTFNWEEPEGGNAWSNLMHKNSKEIGIGGALTKGGNAIIIARVTPVPDLSPETLPKLLPTDARRLPQAYYSFGQQDEPDDFLSLWSKNLGPNMRRKTAPVKQVKMPDKSVSRSSLSSVKFGKEKVRSESERDSGIREEDSNDDVFSSGLNKDRSFGDNMPYGSEKFGKTPIQSPFFNNNADVSFADNASYGNGGTRSVSEMRSPRSFDTSFGDNVKFGSEAVPTPLHFESRGRLITRGSDDEIIEPKREKSKNKSVKSSPKNKVKIDQKQLSVIKGSHRGEWQPRLEVRATGITPKYTKSSMESSSSWENQKTERVSISDQ